MLPCHLSVARSLPQTAAKAGAPPPSSDVVVDPQTPLGLDDGHLVMKDVAVDPQTPPPTIYFKAAINFAKTIIILLSKI